MQATGAADIKRAPLWRLGTRGGGAGPRWRSLPGLVAAAPLAVGRAKGLAAVLVGSRRAVLLDLEEDENEESDEEESDEEE